MSAWSLPGLLESLHVDLQGRLALARTALAHPVSKGDAAEEIWLKLFNDYLPRRYQAAAAHVVDSNGAFSEQIDIVIFDRQYTPPIFRYEGETVIPAESVYAVFEAKQAINAEYVAYAQEKAASVRRLHRTSLPIPTASGTLEPRALPHIIAGLLTLDSGWTPPLGKPLKAALAKGGEARLLDLGCIASHGTFASREDGAFELHSSAKAATAFLLELIARLQMSATVPMIDVKAYARWLGDE